MWRKIKENPPAAIAAPRSKRGGTIKIKSQSRCFLLFRSLFEADSPIGQGDLLLL